MSGPDDDAGLSVGHKRFKNRVGPTAPESVTAMEGRVCAPVDNPCSSGTDPVGVAADGHPHLPHVVRSVVPN